VPKKTKQPFWQRKKLSEMNETEWELICDGCGKCCLHKLEDEDSGEIRYTEVACRFLDVETCRCIDYAHRRDIVSDCETMTPKTVRSLKWIPKTCAYRLLNEGKSLPDWHHLVTGDPRSVHRAHASVRGKAVPEADAGDLEDHVI
jgi:uncharacterized protein